MPKLTPTENKVFYFREPPTKTFCPLCHRVIRYTVPGETVTYLVHAIDDVCVMDNEQVVKSG